MCVCVNEAEEIRFSEKIADVDLTELLFFFSFFFFLHTVNDKHPVTFQRSEFP